MTTDTLMTDPPPPDVRILSARGETLAQHLHPVAMPRALWRHRAIIRRFARSEIVGRYRGSQLGLVWSLVNPLVLLAVYTIVFGVVLPSRWPHSRTGSVAEFSLILFSGLIPFVVFSESASRAPLLVIAVPGFVKKTVFALEILPVALVLAALFHAAASLVILLSAQALITGHIPWTVVFLPLAAIPLVLLTLGTAWFLASFGVFVRDVANTAGIAVQLLFFSTPIFYPPEIVPKALHPLLVLNPMAWIVNTFRRVLLWELPPVWHEWLAWTAITSALAVLGFAWFMKTRRAFADVL